MVIERSAFDDLPDSPAGKQPSNGRITDWDSVFDRIFVPLSKRLLAGRGITVGELFIIADLKTLGYSRANSLGTWLGWGVGDAGTGLRLHKSKKSGVIPCQENLKILFNRASDEQIEKLMGEIGVETSADLAERANSISTVTTPV